MRSEPNHDDKLYSINDRDVFDEVVPRKAEKFCVVFLLEVSWLFVGLRPDWLSTSTKIYNGKC